MEKFLLFFCFIICFCGFAFSQNSQIKRTNHWFFGNHAGIDFSGGSPVAVINSGMDTWESLSK